MSGSVASEHVTHNVSHVGSHAGRGQARRLHSRTAAHHHQARRLHGGRTHTSDRHTQGTQDGRRATTHSACTCRWTSVKHRVGWVGITEASAACAHTEPSSSLQSEHKSDRKQRAFACTSKRFHPLSPHCDQQDQESPAPHTPQFTAAHTSGFRCDWRTPTPRERLRRKRTCNTQC